MRQPVLLGGESAAKKAATVAASAVAGSGSGWPSEVSCTQASEPAGGVVIATCSLEAAAWAAAAPASASTEQAAKAPISMRFSRLRCIRVNSWCYDGRDDRVIGSTRRPG